MGLTFPITGTYSLSKADWYATTEPGQSVNNYQRWVYAHSTVLGDLPSASSYFTRSFNFSCANQSPDNDSSLRAAASSAGFADGLNVAHGSDFLYLGNYVGNQTISNVAGFTVTDGLLYWAGQGSGATGGITRNWLEVLSTSDLSTIPLINGNSYQVNVVDGSGIVNSPNITITYPADNPHTLNTAFDWGEQDLFFFYGTSVNPIISVTINGVQTQYEWSSNDGSFFSETDSYTLSSFGYGKYCVIITDEFNGQYSFSIIVPQGVSCTNSILTTYPFSESGAIAYDNLWYTFASNVTGTKTMQLCATFTIAGTISMNFNNACNSAINSVSVSSNGCNSTSVSLVSGTQYWVNLSFGAVGTEGTFTATIS